MTRNELLSLVRSKMADRPKTLRMFENCFNDTLENTIRFQENGEVFMLTGDIPAMWLRDSTNQLRPYLLTADRDEKVAVIIEGVMKKQIRSILRDPYANAFNECDNHRGHQTDKTAMRPFIWERKYEIDSLCYPFQLAYLYYKNTGRTHHFDSEFLKAAGVTMALWKLEQDHVKNSRYTFERFDCPETDTLPHEGKGNPVAVTGMTWSGFRPSDDACVYGYLVPSNMFAVTVLNYLEEIFTKIYNDKALAEEARALRKDIQQGIEDFAVGPDGAYIYETDGLGNTLFMDDANVPSLLSMPYFGYCRKEDVRYLTTRQKILSEANPYYYEGTFAKGIGSPHTPENYIWHIALAIQGLTSCDEAEKQYLLDVFEKTDAGTNAVHEGFHKDDPTQFTRPWFSWANAVYSEFILSLCGVEVKV
ncbi:MAG: glycoside hydrolase family 125 protein [Clostridia bacterium]|nr:glycoside hydrolase family 125 protein [Clostridia bacterium]